MKKIIYLLFATALLVKPSLALNIIHSNTKSSSEASPILTGFAKELPLKTVLKIVVPPYWNISATTDILESPVTWKGGQNWIDSIQTIAKDHNFVINRDAKSKQITIIGFKKEPDFTILPATVTTEAIINNTTTSKLKNNTPAIKPTPKDPVVIKTNPLKRNISPVTIKTEDLTQRPVVNKATSVSPALPLNIPMNNKALCNIDCQKEALRLDNYYKLKSIFGDLLNDFDYIFDKLEVKKEYRKVSNTVRFDFSFNGVNTKEEMKYKPFKSFIVFTSNSAYSPFFKDEQNSTILDWYNKNFTHPIKPLPSKVIIKDLTLINNEPLGAKKSNQPPVVNQKPAKVIKKEKSFLVNKYYVAKQGLMLSDTIGSWAKMNDISMIWNASNDFKVYKEIKFFSNFLQSTNDIIQFYNNTTNPLQFRFFTKNKTILVEDLAVIHRRQ